MSSDTSSTPDIEEYMASICDKNGVADNNIIKATTSYDDDCSSDEIEIVKELKVNLEAHDCALCCEGTCLVNKLLQFGGILNEEYKHACEICNEGFKAIADLNKHKKLHENGALSEDPGFQDLTSLLNTSNSRETDSSTPLSSRKKKRYSRPVACDVCSKVLGSQRTLTHHKKTQHSNLTYTCDVCDTKFTKYQDFKRHCATHTDSQ